MRDERTEIVVLMDASGSMGAIRDDAVGGFNAFVADQKKEDGEANLTVTFFDSNRYDTWVESIDVKKCPVLGDEYRPSATTPLLDATGRTIEELGARLRALDEAERPGKVMVIVITDGYENSSRVFTKKQIKSMILHQQEVYKWEFVYLGANVDAFAEGEEMGYLAQNIGEYDSSKKGVRAMMAEMSSSARAFRKSGRVEGLGRKISAESDVPKQAEGRDSTRPGRRPGQRAVMLEIFRKFGSDHDRVIREYAAAERRGVVARKSDQHAVSAEAYARALFSDGLRKGWLR